MFGAITSTGAAAFSYLAPVEQWLRIASLLVGIVVGILTAISVIKNILKK